MSPEERALRILRDVKALGRTLGEQHGVLTSEKFPIKEVVLPMIVNMEDSLDQSALNANAATLVTEFDRRLGDELKGRVAFRPGYVTCFHMGATKITHAKPGDLAETFAGYTANGKPVWKTFVNLCLEKQDPRVDLVFADRPQVIAVVQSASELKGELLPGFGRDSLAFNCLGQVVAGLIPLDLRFDDHNTTERVALTVQFIQTRSEQRRSQLRLNLLGLTFDDIARAAVRGHPRDTPERLRRVLREAQRRVDSLGRRAARAERVGKPLALDIEVLPLLSRLKRDIENTCRPPKGRTRHAQQRHLTGKRPTSSALRDVQGASEERCYFDSERKTSVVLGPKNRAHIFTTDGRHVTSLQLRAGELERKTGRRRWRPLGKKQFSVLIDAIEKRQKQVE